MENVRKISTIVSDWINTKSDNIPKSVINEEQNITLFDEMSQLKKREKFAYDCATICSKIHIDNLLKVPGEPKNNYSQFKKFAHALIESYVLKGNDTSLKHIYPAPHLTRKLIAQFRTFLASSEAVKLKKLIPISEFFFFEYCKEDHTVVFIDAFLSASLVLFLFQNQKTVTADHAKTINEFLESAPESFMRVYKKTVDIFNLVKSELIIEDRLVIVKQHEIKKIEESIDIGDLVETHTIRARKLLGESAEQSLVEEAAKMMNQDYSYLKKDSICQDVEVIEYDELYPENSSISQDAEV